jgi:serine protease Do
VIVIMGRSDCFEPGLRTVVWACALLLAGLSRDLPPPLVAAEPLAQLEEQAMKAAVTRVAPCVVRIEAVGGLEQVGGVLIGTGSTTGLVVSEDGYIISSAFNFAQKPDSILVTLPDGTRTAARLVAADFDRKLVLLKVAATAPLAVPAVVPASEIHVGQWALAIGRTFDADRPSISMGIVSAVERIWGKAIQTDAKVSPSNYGGPLVDIAGRVLGVLVPLAPDTGSEVAGVDWYDSGIGFAVPLEHVYKMLPRLKEGHDLKPGILGISLKGSDIFSLPAEIAACRINSPAYKAGIKAGDLVVEADGRPVTRQAQLKTALGGHYAGDHVALVLERGKERINVDAQLTDKLEPYEYPFIGILPVRTVEDQPKGKDRAEGKEQAEGQQRPKGITIRYVYPDSPAAAAGIAVGDVLRLLSGKPVADPAAAAAVLRDLAPEQTAELEVLRDGKTEKLSVKLGRLPEALPGELPPAHPAIKAEAGLQAGGDKPQVGKVSLKLPEFENACLAYVPEAYNPDLAYGLVVWLHGAGGYKEDELLDRWKPLCDAHDLILLAPKSAEPTRWQPADNKFIRRMMKEALANYQVDPARIVVHGQEGGGAMAYVTGFANRDLVRAVATVDAPLPALVQPPENDPVHRLAFYTTRANIALVSPQLGAGIKRLRDLKFPVTVQDVAQARQYLTGPELQALVRWIDTLDRL